MMGLSLSKKAMKAYEWHLKANILKSIFSFSNTVKNQYLCKELLMAS